MSDELIRLDTTIIGIDSLINKASTVEEAKALYTAKSVIYSQQRYAIDVKPVIDTENTATISDEFICKKCGIHLKDYIKVVMDEDNDGYIDEQHYEYEPKFCPECGAKVKEG